MPNTVLETRVRAAYRAQCCAVAIACGSVTFALGSGLAVPLCANAAYIAALTSVPVSGLAALAACRIRARGPRPIPLCLMATAAALLLMLSSVSLASRSLLPQAAAHFVCTLTLVGALLLALCGDTGVSRLSFALRVILPACLLLLGGVGLSSQWHSGLFPLLGMGARPLGLAALCCVSASVPALTLALPPAALADCSEAALACPPPRARFFIWRVMLGSLTGAALVLLLSLCNAYETLRTLHDWGERMLILSRADPHGGFFQEMLTLAQLIALTLGASCLLASAEQALLGVHPLMRRGRAGLFLCAILCAAGLFASLIVGYGPMLLSAPAVLALLALLVLIPRRRRVADI